MKEQDEIEKYLANEQRKLDVFEPSNNHKAKFMAKLEQQNNTVVQLVPKKRKWVYSLAIAASIILIGAFSFLIVQVNLKQKAELASVSPKMESTQNFFNLAIQGQLEEINKNASSENAQLVKDALKQLEKLENDYEILKKDLVQSNNDKRVISAMINNFQKRASLLQGVLEKMNTINTLKTSKNENNIL